MKHKNNKQYATWYIIVFPSTSKQILVILFMINQIIFHKTGKILHSYGDIPADLIQIFHNFIVLNRHYMGISTEIFHCTYFLDTFLYKILKISPDRFLVSGL